MAGTVRIREKTEITTGLQGTDLFLLEHDPGGSNDADKKLALSTLKAYINAEVTAQINAILNSKAQANGIATLNNTGKVPENQLPSYVDDVIEGYYYNSKFYSDSAHTTEITGETGKIYVDLSTDKSYRWSNSVYIEIASSVYNVATAIGMQAVNCTTAGNVASKTVDLQGFVLYKQARLLINLENANTVTGVTLNVNGTGAKTVRVNGGDVTASNLVAGYYYCIYDGTYWELESNRDVYYSRFSDVASNTDYSAETANCTTASGTQEKVVGLRSFTLDYTKATFLIRFQNANSYNGKITLKVNGQTAKDLYINGVVTSSTNKTLPAGIYTCTWNGTYFNIETESDVSTARDVADSATVAYCTCSTGASTAIKEITTPANFVLKTGSVIGVKFTTTNSASNVQLKVGSVTAPIYYNGAVFTNNWNAQAGWANHVIYYMYDGTYFVWLNNDSEADGKLYQVNTTENADYRVLLGYTADDTNRTENGRKSNKLKFNPSTGVLTPSGGIVLPILSETPSNPVNGQIWIQ